MPGTHSEIATISPVATRISFPLKILLPPTGLSPLPDHSHLRWQFSRAATANATTAGQHLGIVTRPVNSQHHSSAVRQRASDGGLDAGVGGFDGPGKHVGDPAVARAP